MGHPPHPLYHRPPIPLYQYNYSLIYHRNIMTTLLFLCLCYFVLKIPLFLRPGAGFWDEFPGVGGDRGARPGKPGGGQVKLEECRHAWEKQNMKSWGNLQMSKIICLTLDKLWRDAELTWAWLRHDDPGLGLAIPNLRINNIIHRHKDWAKAWSLFQYKVYFPHLKLLL